MKKFTEFLQENIVMSSRTRHTEIDSALRNRADQLKDMGHTIHHLDSHAIVHTDKNGQKMQTTGLIKPTDNRVWITTKRT